MRDFTLKMYEFLLDILAANGYNFQTVEDFVISPISKVVILRHDVDLRKWAALRLAKLEYNLGIKSTFYFRMNWHSYNKSIIKEIASLGHEIGYHYEDLASANGNYEIALQTFLKNLSKLREFYHVKTICMHGRSGSPYDNKDLWKVYNYKDFDIICEPYLDFNFNNILYLTDTGRCWNGNKISFRDKVVSEYNYDFKRTQDIIDNIDNLPHQILINSHPEQWTNNYPEWLYIKLFAISHTLYKKYYRNKKFNKR